jgi:hypothetical protein
LKIYSEIFTPFASYSDHLGGENYSTVQCVVPAVKVPVPTYILFLLLLDTIVSIVLKKRFLSQEPGPQPVPLPRARIRYRFWLLLGQKLLKSLKYVEIVASQVLT